MTHQKNCVTQNWIVTEDQNMEKTTTIPTYIVYYKYIFSILCIYASLNKK